MNDLPTDIDRELDLHDEIADLRRQRAEWQRLFNKHPELKSECLPVGRLENTLKLVREIRSNL